MIETEAVVVKIEDATAYVKAERKSGCSACSTGSCGTSVLAGFFAQKTPLYRASNDVGAKVGDRVVVGMDEAAMFKGTLLLYLFPLLLLFVGAVAGSMLAVAPELKDGYSVVGACVGLVAGFAGLKLFTVKLGMSRQFQPVILSLVVGMPIRFAGLEEGLKR